MKYSEEQLGSYVGSVSKTESEKIERAVRMIKEAIRSSSDLSGMSISVFCQGSYQNNTNIRNDSDVDVCVMLERPFYCDYPKGKCRRDYGFTEGDCSYEQYRSWVYKALVKEFGQQNVTDGNKCIGIRSSSHRVEADVVPSFMLRDYEYINSFNPNKYIEGIRYFSKKGETISNYPKIHFENGVKKNNETGRRYKHLVRLFKVVTSDMDEDSSNRYGNITSFLLECLAYNVPNNVLTENGGWNNLLNRSINYIYDNINSKWTEVNGILPLFREGRKWDIDSVKSFMKDMLEYIQ